MIIPAVIALGLAKGGFAGVGVVATPLLALVMPPIEAAAVLLPILMVQDVISVWVYHGDWSKPNLKVMVPGAALGVGAAWLLATYIPDAAVRVIVGMIGVGFVTNIWLGRMPEQVKPNPPPAFSGARSQASPRPSPAPAVRRSSSTSCRSGCRS